MISKDYKGTLELIRYEIQTARFQVVRTITREHIELYWKIGKIILEKQKEEGWGKSVVEKISNDLQKDFPGSDGYSARNLWDMRRFYSRYSTNEKLRQLVAEIPWGQNLLILTKIKDDKEAEFYLTATKEYGWSRNVLLNPSLLEISPFTAANADLQSAFLNAGFLILHHNRLIKRNARIEKETKSVVN